MTKVSIILAVVFGGLLACSGAALAERRVALVVGNSTYRNAPELTNPKNDASDMASALKGLEQILIIRHHSLRR